jgi:hypothetical protein
MAVCQCSVWRFSGSGLILEGGIAWKGGGSGIEGVVRSLLVLLGLMVALPALGAESEVELRKRMSGKEGRILFVGNSYSFKVPGVVARMVRERGGKVVVEQVTRGGWTLRKHAESEETLEKIREGKWDVIVLQEQSQMPSFGKKARERDLNPFAKALADEARKAGAQPVFFLTWGRRDGDQRNNPEDTYAGMQSRLETGYREAAVSAGSALVVPVGKAWAREMKAGRGKGLYAKDGSHPTAEGVRLSAKVFVEFFFGK